MPEVSVVIPSYNHSAYIGEAVESVLGQTLSDMELVVVDDGSTDSSLEVLASYSDSRLRIVTQENRGAHAAINRGLSEASGEYLAILNSDDAYHPRRLETLVGALRQDSRLGLVGSHIQIVDSLGKPMGVKHGYADCEPWLLEAPERSFRAGSSLRDALLTENFLATTSNYVFTRPAFERAGQFLPLRYTHDWDFALRLVRFSGIALISEPLVRYRIHPSNTIRENRAAMVFEICWILAVHLPPRLSDRAWPGETTAEDRVDQLLHSIYTYGMERVLSVLLLQRLHEDRALALRLLDPQDPQRLKYLEYIRTHLNQPDGGTVVPQAGQLQAWKTRLRRMLQ